MKEIDLIIKEKLNKLKITDARYLQEFEQLSNIGFSEQQANQLILRECSIKVVKVVLTHHSDLLINFTHANIVKIARHDGGSKNIDSLLQLSQWLVDVPGGLELLESKKDQIIF